MQGHQFQIDKEPLMAIPIHAPSAAEQAAIASRVEKIIAAKAADTGANTSQLEREIDELVANLYGLDDDEKKLVGIASEVAINPSVEKIGIDFRGTKDAKTVALAKRIPALHTLDFDELVALMALKPDARPTYEFDEENQPSRLARLITAGIIKFEDLLPDEAAQVYMKDSQGIPNPNVPNGNFFPDFYSSNGDKKVAANPEAKAVEKEGILDILGLYFSGKRHVVLYDVLIKIYARKHKWPVAVLRRVVYWHELAHAATHLGLDSHDDIWASFSESTTDIKEYFAQIYAFQMLKTAGDDEAVQVMQELTKGQPSCYGTYLKDKALPLSQLNNHLLLERK